MSNKFEESYGLTQADSMLILGAPGTGKSTFCASVCEVVPKERVVLLCPKPRERNSWGYKEHGLDKSGEIFYNKGWNPELGKYEHDAWKRLLKRIDELQEDDGVDAVILDCGTDAAMLKTQAILGPKKMASIGDLRKEGRDASFSFWNQYSDGISNLIGQLVQLTYASHPKFVIVTWHTQPPKDGLGNAEGELSKYGGVSFEGKVLPLLDGSYRRKMAADFSIMMVSDIKTGQFNSKTKKVETEYVLRVKASADEHVKVASVSADAFVEAHIPNNFKTVFEALK